MVDKPKKKTAKAKQDPPGVLGGLPAERPARIGTRRSGPAAAGAKNGRKPAAKRERKAAAPRTFEPTDAAEVAAGAADERSAPADERKPPAAATTAAGERSEPAARKPRATASRRKAAAPRTFEPTEAAEAAAGAADARAAGAPAEPPEPETPSSYPRPRPVRAAAPGIGTPGYREQAAKSSRRPSGTELASTAVRAAGEVAQVGLTIGGRLVKSALKRVPKP